MTQTTFAFPLEVPNLPEGYSIRRVQASDYNNGVLETLALLTTVGKISKEEFESQIATWDRTPDIYQTMVILDLAKRVVAVGTLIVESKLIHNCGKVGHIEDIAVALNQRGKKLGLTLIRHLMRIGCEAGCYKVILDCDPVNEPFYMKCGLSNTGYEMQYRF